MVSPEHFPSPQGVTAQQKEADVKALEARLKASEHSVEVITSLSTPQLQPPLSASRTITKSSSHLVIPQGLPPPPLLLHDTESTSSEDGKHSDSSSEVSSAVQSRPRSSSHGSLSNVLAVECVPNVQHQTRLQHFHMSNSSQLHLSRPLAPRCPEAQTTLIMKLAEQIEEME
eukprot:Em0008g188a